MNKKTFLTISALIICNYIIAQTYSYTVNALQIKNNKVNISGIMPTVTQNKIIYHFPKVVPGTYAIEDYGKYIEDFKAFTKNDNLLKVNKIGENDFEIQNATELYKINYNVKSAMTMHVKHNKIFEPASTYIEANNNVIMNNGGFFGYLEATENLPIEINITKPETYFCATSLPTSTATEKKLNTTIFQAQNYHQLVDCPILISKPDTAMFYVNNTLVTIACYDKSGTPRAKYFYSQLKNDMDGIAKFLPTLPVNNYTFILYIDNFEKWGPVIDEQRKPHLSEIIPLLKKFSNLGVGALEHGNCSLYYLANFGEHLKTKNLEVANQFTESATHEFMHIVTPLGLHSQAIGNFNYANPIMSKHLWMYEGCTEYFAQLIKLQAGIFTPEKFLEVMNEKIISGNSYPYDKMSFTKMSANCLDKEYNKQYIHVYDRGAVYAWLLDINIIKLTNGKKCLKDVILKLNSQFGKNKSFDEDSLFQLFCNEVSPDLKQFFDKYIDGNTNYDLENTLSEIGVMYKVHTTINAPSNPANENLNDIKIKSGIVNLGSYKIKKVGVKEWAGLQKGDKIKASTYKDCFKPNGKFLLEGETANYKVKRKGKEIVLPVKVKYAMQETNFYIHKIDSATTIPNLYWNKFIGQ